MSISTKLFNERTIRSITGLNDQVNGLQEQVSTGKVDLRPSQDMAAAAKRSASSELLLRVERYQSNVTAARNRLDLADSVMGQIVNTTTRVQELTIQAANDTLGQADRDVIRIEVQQLRDQILMMANTRDAQDQALFAGYRTNAVPFEYDDQGAIVYRGDTGQHVLRIADGQTLATGVDGQSAFLRIDTARGPQGLFDVINRLDLALGQEADADGEVPDVSDMIDELNSANLHLTEQRARLGALGSTALIQEDVLNSRELLLRKSISGLEDADMAEVITQLQTLLLNRDATQQVFAKIGQQSLFDYMS